MTKLLSLFDFDVSSIIAAIITLSASIYIFKTTPKYNLVYKRYKNLISPLFDLVEPNLFAEVTPEILKPILNFIETNKYKSLAGYPLMEYYYFCKKNPSQDNYNALCSCINREYDKCCLRLGLNRRSVWYKIVRNQYKSKSVFILYVTFKTIIFSVVLISFLAVLAMIFSFISNLTGLPLFPLGG